MSDHDPAKPALAKDNPDPPQGGEGDKGLGSQTGAEGAAADSGDAVTKAMPQRRGYVRYPDGEDPDQGRPDAVPQEGHVEEHAKRTGDASPGAKD
jgi:hypothetical protein